MRCLIDAHTLLWWATGADLLSSSTRDFLEDYSNDVLMSIVTPWELAIKTNLGKLEATQLLLDIERNQLDQRVRLLNAELKHVLRAGRLPRYHGDPFDRLMIAQALDLGISIVSGDEMFDRYGVKRIWD